MLNLFETDPDARPVEREEFERPTYAFQLRSGTTRNGQPVSLATWRVLSDTREVIDAFAQAHGGTPDYDAGEIITAATSLDIIIDSADDIESKLIMWGNGVVLHECDGVRHLSPPDIAGTPCGCPELLTQRKDLARKRRGPSPSISIPFRLAHDPELGQAIYRATAWTFAEIEHIWRQKLIDVGGPALCRLELERVQYTTKKGIDVDYVKPALHVIGSYNDAIAD